MGSITLKCKNCGAPLNIDQQTEVNGLKKICCSYCRWETILSEPGAYRVADEYLYQCRFSEASTAYLKIIETNRESKSQNNVADAWFGLALSLFEVQYSTMLRRDGTQWNRPILFYTSDEDFSNTSYFRQALELSSPKQKEAYQEMAQEIDDIRNKYLNLISCRKEYDCFICCCYSDDQKEDEMALYIGSDIENPSESFKKAEDLYDQLRNVGFRPFFAPRETGDLRGNDYEALILFALKTAKTFILIPSNGLPTKRMKSEYLRYDRYVKLKRKKPESMVLYGENKLLPRLVGIDHDLSAFSDIKDVICFVADNQSSIEEEKITANDDWKQHIEDEVGNDLIVSPLKDFQFQDDVLIKYIGHRKKIYVPKFVTKIGQHAFERCSSIEEILLPNHLKEIGSQAFYGCHKIKSLFIPSEVEKIGYRAFCNCESLENIHVGSYSKNFKSVDGVLYSANMETILNYPCGKRILQFTIPEQVKTIGIACFYGCAHLESVRADNICLVEEMAFYNCLDMTQIKLGSNLQYIKDQAFCGCKKLTEIEIPKSLQEMGSNVFVGCSEFLKIYYHGSRRAFRKVKKDDDSLSRFKNFFYKKRSK